jgi:hypothetical protein
MSSQAPTELEIRHSTRALNSAENKATMNYFARSCDVNAQFETKCKITRIRRFSRVFDHAKGT